MSCRANLTPHKLVDFFLAALHSKVPTKDALVALAGGEPTPTPVPTTATPVKSPTRRSARGQKPAADTDFPDASAEVSKAEDEALRTRIPRPRAKPTLTQTLLPEVEAYAHLLVLMFLTDKGDARCVQASIDAASRLEGFNRRTMDQLHARVLFYLSLSHEKHAELPDIRNMLLASLRSSASRFDEIGQESSLNLLLRNYSHYNLYEQAEKLRSKATLPASRSNQQQCRYLYYLGRIRAIQLEYSEAKECLQVAQRKAPKSARGFTLELSKWITVVRLLLGEIPDKKDLTSGGAVTAAALRPYLDLANAVRLGDLEKFRAVADAHAHVFTRDKTTNLVVRLRRNVIRVGLRRVSLAYTKIHLADVASKLGLGKDDDIECVVAKAVRDGGIDGMIDHDAQIMYSKDISDVYGTTAPQDAFHARIAFCLDTHNEAVVAMRYAAGGKTPARASRKTFNEADGAEELAMHIGDDDDMDEF